MRRLDSSAKPSRPLAKPSRPSEEVANVLQQRTVRLQPAVQEVSKDTVKPTPRPRQTSLSVPELPVSVTKQPTTATVEKPATEEDDNWDQDFEDDIPATKIAALDRDNSEKYDSFGTDDNSKTLRPARATTRKVSNETKPMQAIEEDYSDMVLDDKHFKGRVASLRSANSGSKRILHPRDLSNTGSVHSLNGLSGEKTIRASLPTSSSMPNFAAAKQSSPAPSRPLSPFGKVSPPATSALSRSAMPSLPSSASISSIDKYSEVNEDTEDFSDLIGKDPAGQTSSKHWSHQVYQHLRDSLGLQMSLSRLFSNYQASIPVDLGWETTIATKTTLSPKKTFQLQMMAMRKLWLETSLRGSRLSHRN